MSDDPSRTAAAGPGTSPWAADPARATRRFPLEDQGRSLQWRGPFERDRDRVLHARAFRRLGGKSQLLPIGDDRQVRSRLTHTLEIAAAARTLARQLALDEDLTEAIALAHDLGAAPFGKPGQRALNRLLTEGTGRRIPGGARMKLPEGFDPGIQALRVVDRLEVRYDHPGLNLTDATRCGLLQLRRVPERIPDDLDPAGLELDRAPPLEAECVRAAWLAMTPLHDLEDLLSEERIDLAAVLRLDPVARVVARLRRGAGWPQGRFRQRAALHRALVHAALADVLVASRKRLAAHDAAPREAARPLIGPSREGGKLTTSLLVLLERRVLARPELRRADARAERIVEGLFLAYGCDPLLLDDAVLLRYRDLTGRPFLRDLPAARVGEELARHYHGEPRLARLLADHIAGMTDRHAEQSWRALTPSGGYL